MKRAAFAPPVITCLLVALALGALTFGPLMHENDQPWLLDGGCAIARGHWNDARLDFNFPNQYISYWILGILFKCLPQPFNPDDVVMAGNMLEMVVFWGALIWLLSRSLHRLPLALALAVILAPTFLVNSPYYASAFTSGAVLMLLAGFLDREKWNWASHAIVALLAFCAVGTRADATMLLPLLAMLHAPKHTFASVLKSPNTWLMAAAGLAAVVFGHTLMTGSTMNFVMPSVDSKLLLAYFTFGMGGAGVLFFLIFHSLWAVRRAACCPAWLVFTALGAALPMAYYAPQLTGTRHLSLAVFAALVFICAPRGRAVFHLYFRRSVWATPVKCILLFCSVVPAFVGVNLEDLHHPRPTLAAPTLFPTDTGLAPMGAYLAHTLNVHRLHGFVDHNQAVWAAAKTTHFEAGADGIVTLLETPMEAYLDFAIHLQDKRAHAVVFTHGPGGLPSSFYVDSRSLMRFRFVWPKAIMPADTVFAAVALRPATTTDWHGVTILKNDPKSPPADSLSAPLWAFNEIFSGDEFHLEPLESLQNIPATWSEKTLVLASRDDFTLATTHTVKSSVVSNAVLGRWQMREINPLRAGEPVTVHGASEAKIYVAVSALPVLDVAAEFLTKLPPAIPPSLILPVLPVLMCLDSKSKIIHNSLTLMNIQLSLRNQVLFTQSQIL